MLMHSLGTTKIQNLYKYRYDTLTLCGTRYAAQIKTILFCQPSGSKFPFRSEEPIVSTNHTP